MDFIRCEPLYKERVWGSDDPHDFPLGNVLREAPIGEAWDISDRSGDQSIVCWRENMISLRDLMTEYPTAIMGPRWTRERPFPILVKRLFCQKRLSLQVHPPRSVAREYGLPSKDEFWYVLKARNNARIFAGLKKGVTREEFLEGLKREDLEPSLHEICSRSGDALYIPSGRLHALDAGNVILEIQENSDTTFRVYDWGRLGLNGEPRDLHVDQALSSINFDDHTPHVVNTDMPHVVVARCPAFRVHQHTITDDLFVVEERQQPRILSAVDGDLFINGRLIKKGESLILPYDGRFVLHANGKAKFLLTTDFV